MPAQPRRNLFCTDVFRSVFDDGVACRSRSFTPFGRFQPSAGQAKQLGYNGELCEPSGGYSLGAGYRTYSPALFRFHSPDSESPMGHGGLNAYAYCQCDPINATDPSGHKRLLRNRLNEIYRSSATGRTVFGPVTEFARESQQHRALVAMDYYDAGKLQVRIADKTMRRTEEVIAKLIEPDVINHRSITSYVRQFETIQLVHDIQRSPAPYLFIEEVASGRPGTPRTVMAKDIMLQIWKTARKDITPENLEFVRSAVRARTIELSASTSRIRAA